MGYFGACKKRLEALVRRPEGKDKVGSSGSKTAVIMFNFFLSRGPWISPWP